MTRSTATDLHLTSRTSRAFFTSKCVCEESSRDFFSYGSGAVKGPGRAGGPGITALPSGSGLIRSDPIL